MRRPVRVLRRAQRDLQEIAEYMTRESPEGVDGLLDGLLDAVESLQTLSERGSIPRDEVLRRKGYRFILNRGFLIFYKVLPRQVRVYRVLHGKRAYLDFLR